MLKFRAHFNRINMQRGNPNVWTVHNSRGCFQGEKIVLEVPVETVFKPKGQQPRAFFTGRGVVTVEGSTIFVRGLRAKLHGMGCCCSKCDTGPGWV